MLFSAIILKPALSSLVTSWISKSDTLQEQVHAIIEVCMCNADSLKAALIILPSICDCLYSKPELIE